MTLKEHRLHSSGLELFAIERNPTAPIPLLFLHGWLDHCHSFDWLCEKLPSDFRMIALDFRGHGRSAHVPRGAFYGYDQYFADVAFTLRELGLDKVHLVGHSLGGGVALGCGAAIPESLLSITAMETLGPGGGSGERAGHRLAEFVEGALKPLRKRVYPTINAAVERLRENNSGLPHEAALHLVKNGVDEVEGGFVFRFDPAHRRTFGLAWDEDQVIGAFSRVSCPVQILHGTYGFSFDDSQMQARLKALRAEGPHAFEGHHHIHMERPAEVGAAIEKFVRRHHR